MVKCLKFRFISFSSRHRSTCCVQISRNLSDRKSVKLCVAYQKKKFACLSSCRYFVDRAQNLPGPAPDNECCCRFHPNRLTFDGVIAERVKTAKTRHKVNPTFGWNLASSRKINTTKLQPGLVASPPLTSGLETERVYSGRSW